MAKELTVQLENKPGQIGQLGHILGEEGVNITAIAGNSDGDTTLVRFLPDKPTAACEALNKMGFPCTEREVLIVDVLDQPGSLGDVAMVLADAGINIEAVYARIDGKIVMAVDDLDGALQVAHGMAVL